MTFYEILAVLAGAAGLLTPLSVLYAKLIKPVKKILGDISQNKAEVEEIKTELKAVENCIKERDEQATENRVITIKSLVAVLDALEKAGANGTVIKTKKELIAHIAKRAGGGK